ncbi:DUF58 domain-containing protein [Aquibacillus koreensis]|uniref:DUF58 domain-containing protein n=1 Tax=Aquibacillus koreensis TaxID=279446 RepID=A0A9X3WJZ2_9BACI|nr:DUF58 domain-containing protein [Aquibacillus koreensis]MCT2536777.1 DUF58 domain-containing protein [Aquibacillus koreensis]MDC3421467.1 DUF58 domain-containing protein [Aquibacillus koreensis]
MKEKVIFALKLCQVLLLFAIFYTYAMFQGGFVSWFLFYGFLPIILYLFLLLLYPISTWTVKRKIPKHVVQSGNHIQVEIEITRNFAFPIAYLVVEEYFPASLQYESISRNQYKYMTDPTRLSIKRMEKKLIFPWFKRTMTVNYTLNNIPRGEHHMKAIRIKTGDFFGFIKKDCVYQVNNHILAYPHQRKVSLKEKVNSFDEGASPAYTVNHKNTNVVSGVREYMPGDRFSWIDWKTTARKDAVMTKEFEQEKSSLLLLIMDSTAYEGQNKISFEASVELTASIIKSMRNQSSQLSLIAIGEERVYFPFSQDPSKNEQMNALLAKVQPRGDVPFPLQLMQEYKKIPQGIMTMVVITYVDQDMVEALLHLRRKSKQVIVFLIKPASKMTRLDKEYIHQLSLKGVVMNVLMEEQLSKPEIEVSM